MGHGADGNAVIVLQPGGVEVTDQDALVLQIQVGLLTVQLGVLGQDKIGLGIVGGEAQLSYLVKFLYYKTLTGWP